MTPVMAPVMANVSAIMSKLAVLFMIGLLAGLTATDAHPYSFEDEGGSRSSTRVPGQPSRPVAKPLPPSRTGTPRTNDGNMIPAIVGLPPAPDQTEYRLNPQDLVNITVLHVPDLSTTQHIGNTGHIQLPLIGHIRIGGLTVEEAQQRIAGELSRDYLQDPRVNVFVEKYQGLKFTVLGAVGRPGVFDITGQITLLQGLAMAGGFAKGAKEEQIVLIRTDRPGHSQAYIINGEKVQCGALADPILVGGDRIVVPKFEIPFFFKEVLGTVRGFIPFL
uniref:Polysaccharide export outer membrane protein n=1 Tax=Candidatus Kentrum sp. FM TaxID=2126340 RepID=A0A450WNY6_9GAMM|nr:MAG: polysaccharide export outer membrane protein [Candidatus Kentron sp. FM]VFJ66559.1 MAG: polysaccharide export outer membrane protein [Candidatus Kentron sp. FM]VFK18740.1 MAG: polysaccharide export outer membrane protein [Candidatus Kentron sp. FM]